MVEGSRESEEDENKEDIRRGECGRRTIWEGVWYTHQVKEVCVRSLKCQRVCSHENRGIETDIEVHPSRGG